MLSRLRVFAAPLMLATLAVGCGTGTHQAAPRSSPTPPKVTTPAPRPVPMNWPLTGLPMVAGTELAALSVKIDNAPLARPQTGLNSADLVFECLVEGGLSRLMAVYQSHEATALGPIRSARPVDGALLRALNGGIFAYSGAATGEIAPAKAYSTAYLLSDDGSGRIFYRAGPHRAPDNLYASTAALRADVARKGIRTKLPPQLFNYGPLNAGSVPAAGVSLRIGSMSSAVWRRGGAGYLRFENGTAHLLTGGSQISATNVVILHVQVTGSGIRDAAGNEDPFVRAYGRGTVEVLRDGVLERGTWSRPNVASPFLFRSLTGTPLTLTPGRTWIELVPVVGGRVAFL